MDYMVSEPRHSYSYDFYNDSLKLNTLKMKNIGNGSKFNCTVPLETPEKIVYPEFSKPSTSRAINDTTILIAEDEPINFRFLEILLRGKAKKIDHAINGKVAVEMVATNKYDLILMDMRMPVMSGYEATKIIKLKCPDIKIIAQTIYSLPEERNRILELGCDDFISKPITRAALLEVINKVL